MSQDWKLGLLSIISESFQIPATLVSMISFLVLSTDPLNRR